MADYVNLDTVHPPGDGDLVPAAWGHAIGSNFDAWHRPYSFHMINTDAPVPVPDASVTELGYNRQIRSTGDMFTMKDEAVSTFTVPVSGYYLARAWFQIQLADAYPNTFASVFGALMYKDDTDDSHYLLRRSVPLGTDRFTVCGLFRALAGTNLAFVAYQDTGEEASATSEAMVIYTGRTFG